MRKKLRLGAHIWTVEWVKGEQMVTEPNTAGTTDLNSLVIQINTDYPESVQRVTLVHELDHAILYNTIPGEDHDAQAERYIVATSEGLVAILDSTKWVREYLLSDGG